MQLKCKIQKSDDLVIMVNLETLNFIENSDIKSIEKENTYIFCPFEYKNEAKLLGCKFDFETKRWYIAKNNKNYDKVIEKFQGGNFYYNCRGWHYMKDYKQKSHDEFLRNRITY